MLSGFSLPGAPKQKLYWRPDMSVGEFHRPVLLGSGENSWLQGPHGLIVSEAEEQTVGFVFDPMGGVSWVLGEQREQPFSSLSMTYMGEVAPLFGQSDALHIGAAGPVFRGDIAYEPFSDQRYDGVQDQDNLYEKGFHRLPSLRYDKPRSFWRNPLTLLFDLSLMPKMEERISYVPSESLVQWLPNEYNERGNIGIHGLDLFVDGENDALVDLYLEHIFSGKSDPSSEHIIRYILQKEFAEDWMWGTLLNHVIWWNSDTKLDPRLANVLFLE
jgi:hypothetical protein